MYFGVSVPSGLLNPPGRSSSTVAIKPFIKIAAATTIKLVQYPKFDHLLIPAAITATTDIVRMGQRYFFMTPNV